ncbi:hypothetical protein BJX64DRAFT_294373 [Aspergillus heterothallicus]
MPLTPHQSLSLALLIIYTPSLIPTTLLLRRHSVGHAWGWLYLSLFTLLRICGAALQFAAGYTHDPKNGLRFAAQLLASIGVMTLLLGMLEGIEIVKPSLPTNPIPPRVWTLLHVSQYAAFTLSIVFSATGRDDLGYASAVIVACLFVAQAGIVGSFWVSLREMIPAASPRAETINEEQGSSPPCVLEFNNTLLPSQPSSASASLSKTTQPNPTNATRPALSAAQTTLLLRILLISTPFLAVRVTYMLLATFTHEGVFTGRDLDSKISTQSWTNAEIEARILPDVYVVAFMQYVMEIVVFGLFVGVGFGVPASRGRKALRGEGGSQKDGQEGEEGVELNEADDEGRGHGGGGGRGFGFSNSV